MALLKTYTELKSVIKTKLEAIKGSDDTKLFSAVYGLAETEVAGYPCAFIIEQAGKGDIIDTHRNKREWQFEITIFQEIGNKTPEQAQTALLDAVDRVLTTFDEDPYLIDDSNEEQVEYITVVPAEFEYEAGNGAHHMCKLRVACVNLVNRYVQ